MKKLVLLLVALFGVSYVGAWHMPGFWSVVPEAAKERVPEGWRAALNMPTAATPAAGGQQQAGKGGGKGGGQQAGKGGGPGGGGPGGGGPGGGGGQGRPTQVATAQVVRKAMPVRVESLGTVQTIASVTVRARIDSQIDAILFEDGARVKAGDVLARLDSRTIEAQIRQADANLARDKANLELARRTLKRGEELADSNFATKQRLDENRSAVAVLEAALRANEAALENLRTQLSYYTIKAPISGKAGLANLKPGNIAQAAAAAITTINQISPIYIAFSLPQRDFAEVQASLTRGDSVVQAIPLGADKSATGKLALIENTMDNATGTIGVRAVFDNADEALWPGAIANVKITLRTDADVVTVPRDAVQMSQRGAFVFVVKEGVAKMQTITPGRAVDRDVVVTEGLKGGETVIVDGQLLVVDGGKVQQRQGQSSALPGEKSAGAL